MRLRKKRKTPKRYDDYRWEAEDRVEAHSTTPSPISRTRSPIGTRPSNLPFNPNLPPAAFPTLEYGVPRRADPIEIQPPCPADTTSLVINKKWRSQMNWLGYRRSQALKEGEARIPTSPHDETFPNVNLESMFDDSLGSTSPTKLTDSTWHSMVPDSEVYDRNMRILEKMAKRTDDDWNIVEMITSDDESLSPVKSAKTPELAHKTPLIPTISTAWDELSIAHQLDLIYIFSEISPSIEDCMKQLHLTPLQAQRLFTLLKCSPELDVDDLRHVPALQAAFIKIMLAPNSDEDEVTAYLRVKIPPRRFPDLAKAARLTLSTSLELAKAKAYLESCGKKLKLLDHWRGLSHDQSKMLNENRHIPISNKPISTTVEMVRSNSMPDLGSPEFMGTAPLRAEEQSRSFRYQPSNGPTACPYLSSSDNVCSEGKFAKLNQDGKQPYFRPTTRLLPRPSQIGVMARRLSCRSGKPSSICKKGLDGSPGDKTVIKKRRALFEWRDTGLPSSAISFEDISIDNTTDDTMSDSLLPWWDSTDS